MDLADIQFRSTELRPNTNTRLICSSKMEGYHIIRARDSEWDCVPEARDDARLRKIETFGSYVLSHKLATQPRLRQRHWHARHARHTQHFVYGSVR